MDITWSFHPVRHICVSGKNPQIVKVKVMGHLWTKHWSVFYNFLDKVIQVLNMRTLSVGSYLKLTWNMYSCEFRFIFSWVQPTPSSPTSFFFNHSFILLLFQLFFILYSSIYIISRCLCLECIHTWLYLRIYLCTLYLATCIEISYTYRI